MTIQKVSISVAVPLYNEEESAPVLYEQLKRVLGSMNESYEIIFVDDGSEDNTFEVICHIAEMDPMLRVIKFRKNFGQTPAMAAGIDHANGEIIMTMDGDLQNDPTDIPHFVEEIRAGNDIVVGWRHDRKDKMITRKVPSVIANRIIGWVTGVSIKDNGCSLKAYRADVIKNVPLYAEMHRFIPAMANVSGARVKEIKVKHHARQFGQTKYGLSRVYKVLIDLVGITTLRATSFAPMRWFCLLAAPFLIVGLALVVASALSYLAHGSVSIVFAGTGLMLVTLATSLFFGGTLVELVVRTGNLQTRDRVTSTLRIH